MSGQAPPPPPNDEARADAAYKMLRDLAGLAITIALEAPAKFKGPGYWTYVQRETVTRIRAVCDANNIDWRTQHKLARGQRVKKK